MPENEQVSFENRRFLGRKYGACENQAMPFHTAYGRLDHEFCRVSVEKRGAGVAKDLQEIHTVPSERERLYDNVLQM